ncbi:MAG: hypothetical protein IKF11_08185 [Methanobrevibacter sp.]|nr:hypothetical protein [Methanobrevibacter sp.]
MDPVWRLDSYWLMLEGLWDSLGTLPGEVWNSFGTISDNFNIIVQEFSGFFKPGDELHF